VPRTRSPALEPKPGPDPVIEAYKREVDRTLLRENLRLAPDERLRELVRLQRLADELKRSGSKALAPFEERERNRNGGAEPSARSGPVADASRGRFPAEATVKIRDVIKLIEQDGWVLVVTRGSHRQFKHPVKLGRVTVAGQPGHDIAGGTLNSILKQAGLKR
jgi:predicted RNA binding protein YcfA (HicA-like mRNA interferase family)